jgi:hypothetical protein
MGALPASSLVPPPAWRDAKQALKRCIKESQASVTALLRDLDNFGVGLQQQTPRPEHAQLRLLLAQRNSEALEKNPAGMAFTALETPRQQRQRNPAQLRYWHLLRQFQQSLPGLRNRTHVALGMLQVFFENQGEEAEQLDTPCDSAPAVTPTDLGIGGGNLSMFIENPRQGSRVLSRVSKSLALGQGQDARQHFGKNAKTMPAESSQAAGQEASLGTARNRDHIATGDLTMAMVLAPVAEPRVNADEAPTLAPKTPLLSRRKLQRMQRQMSVELH